METLVECPNCLGEKVVYEPISESEIICPYCNGKGEVTEKKAEEFDPDLELY